MTFSQYFCLLGVIPPFLMLWYAERFERRIKEPRHAYRYRVLVAGAVICVPLLWLTHAVARILPFAHEPSRTLLEAYLVSASLEETGKAVMLYTLTRMQLGPRTRYGAFLYGLHASAGFALAENVGLLFYAWDFESFTVRFVLRAYMASPMHLFVGGVLGYLWSRRRFDGHPIGLIGGLGVAILIHGTYNALLLAVERLPEERTQLVTVCAGLAMAVPIGGVGVLRLLAGRLREEGEREGR